MRARIEYFQEHMPETCDAVIITNGSNRSYLTGFSSSAGTLFMTRRESWFIVDGRYIEAARQKVSGSRVCLEEDLDRQLKELVQRHCVKTIGIEADSLNVGRALHWQEILLPAKVMFGREVQMCLEQLRSVKSAEELAAIRRAQEIADQAFMNMLNFVRPGVHELDLAIILGEFTARHGCEKRSFHMIFTSGAKTSLPHGAPPDRCLEAGDFVMVDMGCMIDGYSCDITRTFAVRSADEEQRRIYEIVRQAQERAIDAIRPGVLCSRVDAAARGYIEREGFGPYFNHNLGHSIGLDVHENPRFAPWCHVPLKVGHVISVEPGIYLPGRFGVRIEDLAHVTEHSCELFSGISRGLIIV